VIITLYEPLESSATAGCDLISCPSDIGIKSSLLSSTNSLIVLLFARLHRIDLLFQGASSSRSCRADCGG